MTEDAFKTFVADNPVLKQPLQRAAAAAAPRTYGPGVTEVALLVAMFPIVRYIVVHIGLPWLHEAARYSELWREKFHRWIDAEYQRRGFDPDEAETAGEALRKELERTTDLGARAAWEQLATLLAKGGD